MKYDYCKNKQELIIIPFQLISNILCNHIQDLSFECYESCAWYTL